MSTQERNAILVAFFLGGTILMVSIACYIIACCQYPPHGFKYVWFGWMFLLANFWWANSPFYEDLKAWKERRRKHA